METNVINAENVKNTWLLKVSSKTQKGSLQVQYLQYSNKTKEEIMVIANRYCSSYQTLVRVYKLEETL
jgi:hypothetical protein